MNFKGIIGHKRQIKKLELLYSNNAIPQAMLFSGISGIGKRAIAVRFIKGLFCSNQNPPCRSCPVCVQIIKGSFPDMIELSPNDKGIIPIGDPKKRELGSVRWLIDRLAKKPLSGRYAVLLDGIDQINIQGQNALLKAIEEPPPGTHIFLITANKSKVIPTILSRCSELTFYPLNNSEMKEILKDKPAVEGAEPDLISEISGGSVEVALMLNNKHVFDEVLNLCCSISNCINNDDLLFLDMSRIQKETKIENLLNILINIYRVILISNINKKSSFEAFKTIEINDILMVRKLIKIFLSIKKGLVNNINFRNSLKGMVYSINNIDEIGIPELDFSL
ncbi:ATP-binding protein [Spirochaetota bacterium]